MPADPCGDEGAAPPSPPFSAKTALFFNSSTGAHATAPAAARFCGRRRPEGLRDQRPEGWVLPIAIAAASLFIPATGAHATAPAAARFAGVGVPKGYASSGPRDGSCLLRSLQRRSLFLPQEPMRRRRQLPASRAPPSRRATRSAARGMGLPIAIAAASLLFLPPEPMRRRRQLPASRAPTSRRVTRSAARAMGLALEALRRAR